MKYFLAGAFAAWMSVGFVSAASARGHRGGGRQSCDHSSYQAPEIDPAGAAPALALALGGLAVLAGRRRRQSH